MRPPQPDMLLSTAQVADLLGVSAATVKRWAEAGVLPSARTRGGHRRFRRSELQAFDHQQMKGGAAPVTVDEWLEQLLGPGSGLALDATLMEARGQLGSWHGVAQVLGPVLEELGARWERGAVTVLEEHVAAARLTRALARAAEQLPVARSAPRVLLATPPGEHHTLGLALAELCFREAGRSTVWAGEDVPVGDLEGWIADHAVSVLALSASVVSHPAALAETVQRLAPACTAAGASLILGGRGAWPAPPPEGSPSCEVLQTWPELRAWLLRHGPPPARARGPG